MPHHSISKKIKEFRIYYFETTFIHNYLGLGSLVYLYLNLFSIDFILLEIIL